MTIDDIRARLGAPPAPVGPITISATLSDHMQQVVATNGDAIRRAHAETIREAEAELARLAPLPQFEILVRDWMPPGMAVLAPARGPGESPLRAAFRAALALDAAESYAAALLKNAAPERPEDGA